jgi:NAD(P)-dependent dehydrogenase (short-subunit alcohol dehydrogenase family)
MPCEIQKSRAATMLMPRVPAIPSESAIPVLMIHEYRARVAVITGAASGLGSALAKELAARKCNLALVDIDSSKLPDVREHLARLGVAVTHHCADVGSEQEVRRVAGEIETAHGAVHLVINNAAVSASSHFANTAAEDFDRIIRVNFLGAVYGCRAFLPLLQEHAEGQILNVASCFAWLGYPGKTAYASSKGALRAFSESLRLELASTGVGVTLLYPGPLPTSLVRNGVSDSEERREREEQFLLRRGIPLERVARRCLDKLLTNPSRIVVGFDYRLLDVLARLSPRLAGLAMEFGASRARF